METTATNLEIKKEESRENVKLTIKGRIDSINAETLQTKLEEIINSKKSNIVLNFSEVEYLCSTGIRAILKAYKNARDSGGKVGIERPSEIVKRVLDVTSLSDMLII
jgi:anti-anti-sigma factor